MSIIGELAVNIVARTGDLLKGIKRSKSEISGLRKGFGDVTKSIHAFSSIALGIGGGLSLAGFASSLRESAQRIDDLAKTSRKLGIATNQLAGLQVAADHTGVDIKSLNTAIQRMVRRIAQAATGTGEAKDAIIELGLSASELKQLSPDEQFRQIADAFGNVSNQSDKVRLAFKLFDTEGVNLVRTLGLGREGLEKYRIEAEKLGIAVSEEDAAQVERFNDAVSTLRQNFQGLASKVLIALAPGTAEVLEGLTIAIDQLSGRPEERGAAARVGRTITRGAQEGLIPNIGPALERFFTNAFFGGVGGQNAGAITDRERQQGQRQAQRILEELRASRIAAQQTRDAVIQQGRPQIVGLP